MWSTLFGTFKFKNTADRIMLKDMFETYMSDIPKNFYRNHFELQAEYEDTTYEDWLRIITHPAFDSWKAKQIAIIASTTTDKALAGGSIDQNALSVLKMRQEVLNAEKKVEKPTIIVIPESLFFKDEE